jgi:hypothetical protein
MRELRLLAGRFIIALFALCDAGAAAAVTYALSGIVNCPAGPLSGARIQVSTSSSAQSASTPVASSEADKSCRCLNRRRR